MCRLSCLGKRMKYSCCLYPTGKETLDQAEELMLESYCVKAKLEDGLEILDLGCGWGSLSLFLGEVSTRPPPFTNSPAYPFNHADTVRPLQKYPNAKISSLSNSRTQKIFIDEEAKKRGLTNITVYTGDVNSYEFPDHIK